MNLAKRWKMSPKTFFAVAGVALDPAFTKVLMAVEGTFYFLNRKVFFDAALPTGTIIVEDDPDSMVPKGKA